MATIPGTCRHGCPMRRWKRRGIYPRRWPIRAAPGRSRRRDLEASGRGQRDGDLRPARSAHPARRERRIVRANPAADALLGPLAGRDLFAVLRYPTVIEAVDARSPPREPDGGVHLAGAGGAHLQRPRRGAAAADRRRHGGAAHAARPDADQARRPDARRLRRQRQPRAAHAAGHADRLHRDAARAGQGRRRGARALPRHHAGAGRAHGPPGRRPPVAVAHRAERAHAADRRRRAGADPARRRRHAGDEGQRQAA